MRSNTEDIGYTPSELTETLLYTIYGRLSVKKLSALSAQEGNIFMLLLYEDTIAHVQVYLAHKESDPCRLIRQWEMCLARIYLYQQLRLQPAGMRNV